MSLLVVLSMHVPLCRSVSLLPLSDLLFKLSCYLLVDKLHEGLFVESVVEPLRDVWLLLLSLPRSVLMMLVVVLRVIIAILVLVSILRHLELLLLVILFVHLLMMPM